MSEGKRVQLRGECCICGRQHALRKDGASMVNHGYTVEYGFFSGVCTGADQVHYGHKDAPKVLANYIERLNAYLASLPERIESLKPRLAAAKQECDSVPFRAKEAGELREKVRALESALRSYQHELDGGVEFAIKEAKRLIQDWKEVAPVAVDLIVEARQAKEARAQVAAARAAAKVAAAKAKEERRLASEGKRNAKQVKLDQALALNTHCEIYYRGKVLKSWQQSFENEAHAMKVFLAERSAHWASIGGDVNEFSYVNLYAFNVRRDRDGKAGMSVYDFLIQPTLTVYLKMFK